MSSNKTQKSQTLPEHIASGHLHRFTRHWNELHDYLHTKTITVDGQSLSLAAVVAVSNYNAPSRLSEDHVIVSKVQDSFRHLMSEIDQGNTIYGVNTGFGGSADLRTEDTEKLHVALMQLLNVGIFFPSSSAVSDGWNPGLQLGPMRPNSLPEPIVRGMMLVRCNSLMRGHSGVALHVIQRVHRLLVCNATPIVPLRGSISASGDLIPLSYIASTLTGNPDVFVKIRTGAKEMVMTADKALKHLDIEPIKLGAKCGLAIANGSGTSAAAASLALFQSHQLAIWTQLLTAMMCEATVGSMCNFASFISQTRPHPGQVEVSSNLTNFLKDSHLVMERIKPRRKLAQDRYSLRTAPQWIGPVLERLNLADQQVEIELNSTTDNPLIDTQARRIYNGGNFQAASLTSAMELVSSAMQMLGRLVYAQCSELLNHSLNPDLPPNLSADNPSQSLPMKGLDISMSAYMAELAQLTHPVSSHIQSAEMHNQAVNSMALVAARIALDSIDVLYLMMATYIYALCQAMDLRCLLIEHLVAVRPCIDALVRQRLGAFITHDGLARASRELWQAIESQWTSSSDLDLESRCTVAVTAAIGPLLDIIGRNSVDEHRGLFAAMELFRQEAASALQMQYTRTQARFFNKPPTADYLGTTSRSIYLFIREDLGIPMHKGLIDHPTIKGLDGSSKPLSRTVGSWTSDIYAAVRHGGFFARAMDAIEKATENVGSGINGETWTENVKDITM